MQSTTTGPVTRRHNFFPKFPLIKTKIERARDNRTPQQQQQCNNTSHKILKTDSESSTKTSIAGSKDKTWPQCGADPVGSPYNNQSSAGQGKKMNKKKPEKRKKKKNSITAYKHQTNTKGDEIWRYGGMTTTSLCPPPSKNEEDTKKMREKKQRKWRRKLALPKTRKNEKKEKRKQRTRRADAREARFGRRRCKAGGARERERAPAGNALQERCLLKTGLNLRPPNFTVVTASLFCGHNDHVVSP